MSAHARGPRRPRLAVLLLGLALVHAPSAYGQETEPSEADAASEPLAGSTSFEQLQTRVRSLAARHAQEPMAWQFPSAIPPSENICAASNA